MDSPVSAPPGGLLAAYDAHRDALRRFLVARCGDAAEGEDLMQELWLAAHNGAGAAGGARGGAAARAAASASRPPAAGRAGRRRGGEGRAREQGATERGSS